MTDKKSTPVREGRYKNKAPSRGGARPGSGRPKGQTNKLSAADILKEIAKRDVPFEKGLAEDYVKARQSGDFAIIQKYQQMLLSKVIADKQELDVTSNGQTLAAAFEFKQAELTEWNKVEKKVKIDK